MTRTKTRVQGTIRPDDPFKLVSHIARSQTDPRKATAELVQNSLDAKARRVFVTRTRERGEPVLKIADDGEGVLPGEPTRIAALQFLATHVGSSLKGRVPPEKRAGALGQYGIGLIGFWAIGAELELRSRVAGGSSYALFLRENDSKWTIEPTELSPAAENDPLAEATCTEVVVRGIHASSLSLISGRRLADYLAFELRGQIQMRTTQIVVRDDLARGRAAKLFRVEPKALEGAPLGTRGEVLVSGQRAARLELRVLPEGARGGVALACDGAIVADDLAREPHLGLDHPPWTDPRLGGLIDAGGLEVAHGSRRGVVPGKPAEALREALVAIEPEIQQALAVARSAPARELEQAALVRLRRAFLNLTRELPRYELLAVQGRGGSGPAEPSSPREGVAEPPEPLAEEAGALSPRQSSESNEPGDPADLASVRIEPLSIVVAPGRSRHLEAIPFDGQGRRILADVAFAWSLEDPALASLEPTDASRVRLIAGANEGATSVRVAATAGERALDARARVVVRAAEPRTGSGVPDPVLVDDLGGTWRTRIREGRWEVNASHRDYQLVRDSVERRLQYLVLLLAKEVVQRVEGRDERLGEALDALVEVAGYALRQA